MLYFQYLKRRSARSNSGKKAKEVVEPAAAPSPSVILIDDSDSDLEEEEEGSTLVELRDDMLALASSGQVNMSRVRYVSRSLAELGRYLSFFVEVGTQVDNCHR